MKLGLPAALCSCCALLGVISCAHEPIEHHTRVPYGPLKDVILLPLTTRDTEGLLGHVLHADGVTPDRSRSIFAGQPRLSDTSQRVSVVRRLDSEALVSTDYAAVEAEVSQRRVTHLAYVVEVTGYADVSPGGEYVPQSDCCFNGEADAACAQGYVLRLVRGSGVVKYLQQAQSGLRLDAASMFRTRLGESFVVVDESAFRDAYFAFEPGDMHRLCATLPDTATFAELAIVASPNCSAMAYDVEGRAVHLARYLPDAGTCRAVAEHLCSRTPEAAVACIASFGGQPLDVGPEPPAGEMVGDSNVAGGAMPGPQTP